MFTGIIETLGKVVAVQPQKGNVDFWVESPLGNALKIDQSLAHEGVCLTVVETNGRRHRVTAVAETLQKTSLGSWEVGKFVNLERCMLADARFDGHIVQGHTDQTGICTGITDTNGSWLFDFSYSTDQQNVTVEKGSICVNGTSLTVVNSRLGGFSVAIIPYTYAHTTFQYLSVGSVVNLEFDIVGKYIRRLTEGYMASC